MSLSTITTQTMSSKEIAEYTKKTHSNVMRDIRVMLEAIFDVDFHASDVNYLLNQYVKFDNCPQTGRISCYYLDKELTMSLITGYNAKIRHAMVLRWQELESAKPAELSRLDILTMAIETEKENLQLKAKIEVDADKVSFVEDYVEHGNSKCFRDVAAILGVKQSYFTSVLQTKNIVYKKGGEYKAYSDFAKYFEVKAGINNYVDDSGKTQQKAYSQLRINSAGIVYLASRFGNPELKQAAQPPIVHPVLEVVK